MQGITAVELTEHAYKLIDAIRQAMQEAGNNEPVDRKQMSKILGRSIGGSDIAVLDLLEINGVIEVIEKDTKAPSGIKKLYRVIEE